MTPDEVATYADKDSMALSKVAHKDIIDEILVRATESCTLAKLDILSDLQAVIKAAERSLEP